MSDNSQYRDMFVSEALEHIEEMNKALLELEQNPKVKKHIDQVFRSAHTVKGMAATMGYDQIRELCKNIENVFDTFRKGDSKPTLNIINSIFVCIDVIQKMIQDEKKVVEIKKYIHMLQHPEEDVKQDLLDDSSQQITSPTIRVNMKDLDKLVNLVGELIISKMTLEQVILHDDIDETKKVITTLNRLIKDLHYHSMNLRLVSVDQVFNRFPRLVRDISVSLKKNVNLEIDSGNLELDRTVLNAITDPLLHMIRNSVDHGIESPEEREKTNKPKTAIIKLSAYRVGDKVAVRLDDDGRGINLEAIKEKAVEKKLISRENASKMSTEEIINLLGTPGLSTAKIVTDVSGRGVGMDVVLSQIKSVGGTVKIETRSGHGTSITMLMPMTLSIIGGLMVNVSNQKYVVPLSSIVETLLISKEQIQSIKGNDAIILRGKVISLVKAANYLDTEILQDNSHDKISVVVVDKSGKLYGLVVDSFDKKQEIVIKRINNTNNMLANFTNATILPDGSVALILDPNVIV